MDVLQMQSGLSLVVLLVLVVVKAFAFINALTWSAEHYEAAGKLTKVAWCLITGLSLVAEILIGNGFSIINIAFTVATIVYLVDVRPALRELDAH